MKWEEIVLDVIPDEHVKMVVSMMHTGIMYEKLMSRVLKNYNISNEQFSILKILEVVHPDHYCLKDIQERLINQTTNTTRLVEKLRQKEFVTCDQNTENRRKLNISITKKGLQLLQRAEKSLDTITIELKKVITQKESKVLLDKFQKIQQMLSKHELPK